MRSGNLTDTDNEGHNGWTIAQIAGQVTGWLAAYKPDVVLLHIGTNDVKTATGAVGAPQRLSALIDQLRGAAPNATVIVAQIVPSPDSATNARIVAYNDQIPAIVAGKGTPKVRLANLYNPLSRTSDMADGLHPNDSGYVKMAAAWEPLVTPLLPTPHGISGRGKCIDAASPADLAPVAIWTCHSGAHQRWSRTGDSLRAMGKCLDVQGGQTANGSSVVLWPCQGSGNQAWQLRDDGSILNPKSGRCLDIPFGDTTDGNRLVIWDCNGGLNQRWTTRA
jgi:lysophospholipase L1-like esterase